MSRNPPSGRTHHRIAAAVAAAVSAAWLVASPAGPATAATGSESRMASEIAAQINAERAARGLSRLTVDGNLGGQAQAIAESNRNNGCHACHSGSLGQGEVVQWSGGPGDSGRSTVAWMQSTTHRDILMSPGLTAIGVGLACYPDGGQEAVGRVAGTVTSGTPPVPVVTSRQSGSACDGPSPTTAPTSAVPTVTASPPATGQSGSKSSDNGTGSSPVPTAAPGRPAAAAVTTTTRRPASGSPVRRSPATTVTAGIDDAQAVDIFGSSTTVEPPPASTTTTTGGDDRRATGSAANSLGDGDAGARSSNKPGAIVVGMGLVALGGATLWRTRDTVLQKFLRR